jgi:DNA-binding XRE family transcriptional regulator
MLSGADIRRVRQRLGLTQYEAAAGIGVSRRTLSRWENAPVLHRRVAAKVQRMFWTAARQHSCQTVCPTCAGAGLVPRDDFTGKVLPKIPGLSST